jgi:hypothetical protein
LLYINDLPTTLYSTTATFADNTAVMAVGESNENSTKRLQSALKKIAMWTNKWRIKLNKSYSVCIDFTNKRITQRPIYVNGTQIPYSNTAKYEYLGMTLDIKLRWKEHIKMKFRKMYWLLGRNSEFPFTTNSSYINKFYNQYGVMISSFGAVPVIQTSK